MTFTIHASHRRLAAALAAIALVSPLAACGSSSAADSADTTGDGTTVRVAYLSTANYLTTSKDDDFMKEALRPDTVEFKGPFNPTDAFTAVTSGAADATSTGTGHFIDLIAEGQPWVAFALEYYSGDSQGIVAAPDSGIESLEDLYGKKVAITTKGATGDYIVHQAFAHAGLDASKVEEVELSASNLNAAFTSGQVDAVATFDQNLAAAMVVPGAKLLVDGTQYDSLNVSIHMVSKQFAEQHPDLVRKMYQALVEESDKAQKDPSVITDAYREFGASDDLVEQIAEFDVPVIRPIDADGLAMLEQQARQYVDFGFIDSAPDLKDSVIDCSE
ncbi:extracellular solute-binding protein family 3 [Bifidobacterium lemurum]|uniref:Extracellular solute-binding protein family 3 n=2 Tax=Bifidobacterium lemurum TaxID=1603886 RepID=A0A261FTK5_9BIFI|nr:NrtA/SsuA/CpmA family ABC transporter substrate-binding protein [Bifidobacterium lemurum]OZG62418.1 extracellular solute-binding protein family 3 [Bifidobacterium lemurum]QOL33768.1 NrtA/SsuA/CpmA family ABC transporter substrate-binding protein [Bifidobacterium lemurum]